MYQYYARFVTLLILALNIALSGCSSKTDDQASGKIQAVATIGMIADVVQNIGGDAVDVHGLMGPGVDPHLYKATPSDIQALQSADIIFYNGLHLEAKMGELFEKMGQTRATVAVTKAIPKEQLLAHPDYDGLHDPHVWFDVELWQMTAKEIALALQEMNPALSQTFDQNLQEYLAKLEELHNYVADKASSLRPEERILVTAHDAFGYFGAKYEFEVLGLQGISTESEAGTGDVQALVKMIVDKKIKAIFFESSVPAKNIQAVQEAVKAKGWDVEIGGELFSDAMGSAGTEEGTYLGMVRHNINTIVNALSGE